MGLVRCQKRPKRSKKKQEEVHPFEKRKQPRPDCIIEFQNHRFLVFLLNPTHCWSTSLFLNLLRKLARSLSKQAVNNQVSSKKKANVITLD